MADRMKLVADMLPDDVERALGTALQRFYKSEKLYDVWPAVAADRPELKNVELVVLPLDRIGAPAGIIMVRHLLAQSGRLSSWPSYHYNACNNREPPEPVSRILKLP